MRSCGSKECRVDKGKVYDAPAATPSSGEGRADEGKVTGTPVAPPRLREGRVDEGKESGTPVAPPGYNTRGRVLRDSGEDTGVDVDVQKSGFHVHDGGEVGVLEVVETPVLCKKTIDPQIHPQYDLRYKKSDISQSSDCSFVEENVQVNLGAFGKGTVRRKTSRMSCMGSRKGYRNLRKNSLASVLNISLDNASGAEMVSNIGKENVAMGRTMLNSANNLINMKNYPHNATVNSVVGFKNNVDLNGIYAAKSGSRLLKNSIQRNPTVCEKTSLELMKKATIAQSLKETTPKITNKSGSPKVSSRNGKVSETPKSGGKRGGSVGPKTLCNSKIIRAKNAAPDGGNSKKAAPSRKRKTSEISLEDLPNSKKRKIGTPNESDNKKTKIVASAKGKSPTKTKSPNLEKAICRKKSPTKKKSPNIEKTASKKKSPAAKKSPNMAKATNKKKSPTNKKSPNNEKTASKKKSPNDNKSNNDKNGKKTKLGKTSPKVEKSVNGKNSQEGKKSPNNDKTGKQPKLSKASPKLEKPNKKKSPNNKAPNVDKSTGKKRSPNVKNTTSKKNSPKKKILNKKASPKVSPDEGEFVLELHCHADLDDSMDIDHDMRVDKNCEKHISPVINSRPESPSVDNRSNSSLIDANSDASSVHSPTNSPLIDASNNLPLSQSRVQVSLPDACKYWSDDAGVGNSPPGNAAVDLSMSPTSCESSLSEEPCQSRHEMIVSSHNLSESSSGEEDEGADAFLQAVYQLKQANRRAGVAVKQSSTTYQNLATGGEQNWEETGMKMACNSEKQPSYVGTSDHKTLAISVTNTPSPEKKKLISPSISDAQKQAEKLHAGYQTKGKTFGRKQLQVMSASQKMPAASQRTPAVSQMTPSVSQMTPAVSQMTPAVSQMTPGALQMTPSASQMTPSVSQMTPAVSQMTPAVSQMTPAVSQMTPGALQMTNDTSQMCTPMPKPKKNKAALVKLIPAPTLTAKLVNRMEHGHGVSDPPRRKSRKQLDYQKKKTRYYDWDDPKNNAQDDARRVAEVTQATSEAPSVTFRTIPGAKPVSTVGICNLQQGGFL